MSTTCWLPRPQPWRAGLRLTRSPPGAAALSFVPGRFQTVDAGQPFAVVVDYAHTDDALRNLIALGRDFVKGDGGRVITLFGCGGDRDRTKRPLMGRAAGEGSDFVVLTSDNPRSEDPVAILEDVLPALRETRTPFRAEPDRALAIRLALAAAKPGDIVLLAGKGHEKVQVLRHETVPFDDAEIARADARRSRLPAERKHAMKLELEQIAQWTGAGLWFAPGELTKGPATGYSIDSRTLSPGDLFFAIQGERFDGHELCRSGFGAWGPGCGGDAQQSRAICRSPSRRRP